MADTSIDQHVSSAREDGILLGLWIAEVVKPQLAKWRRSRDDRVRHLALTIENWARAKIEALDWAALGELHDAWQAAETEVAKDAGA